MVANANGTVTFTPDPGSSGLESIDPMYSGVPGPKSYGWVDIDVGAGTINQAPWATDDFFKTAADTILVLTAKKLMNKDWYPQNDPLSITTVATTATTTSMMSTTALFQGVPAPCCRPSRIRWRWRGVTR